MRLTRSTTKNEEAELEVVLKLSAFDANNNIPTATESHEILKLDVSTEEKSASEHFAPATITKSKSTRVAKRGPKSPGNRPLRSSTRIAEKETHVVARSRTINAKQVKSLTLSASEPRKTRSGSKKDKPASAIDPKCKVSGRIQKEEPLRKQVRERTTFKIKLASIPYKQLDYKTLKSWEIRRPKLEKSYWPYPHYRGFKLGHNPWAHLNWPAPDVDQIRKVHRLLADHHKKFDFDSYVSMPSHATEAKVTIDAIFQTLFAQSTDNEIAIDTHSRLCNAFPYLVGGNKHVGKIPNWHDIRLLERDELPAALQQGGFHEMRAGFVRDILDCVYQKNLERKASGKQQYEHEGNPPDAKDFVPGMLSMDWLTDKELDNSDEAILGRLIQLNGIGIKSAMCVMAFSMKRPLFVVDVHVLRYAQWLGWVPSDANNVDWVAMYLHEHIPDDIKYDLHNQIWTHCANENSKESKTRAVICPFCGARPPARARDVSQHVCPLAEFLPPLEKRWGKAYTLQLRQEAREAARSETANHEATDDQVAIESTELVKRPGLRQKAITESPNGLPTPPSSPMESSFDSDDIADAKDSKDGDLTEEDFKVENSSTQKKQKMKKLNLNAKSHRFEDISKEQAEELKAAGYYLWEFRPMDNTFMEEWGTFEKKPRYKWERDTIMDKDVAVTWEYANDVLNDIRSHPWTRRSGLDIVNDELMTGMES